MARWQDYEEKQEKVSENDELLINSGGIVKRIKALKFKGEKGDKGLTGEKGDPFRFNDFTPEQLQSIKGEKGDAFEYSDFTEEQLEALRGPQGVQGETGEKGDPGEKGETGETGPEGPPGRDGTGTGDMLKSENLAGLSSIEEARENLEVYSKNEIENKIENLNLSDENFTLAEKNKLASLENFSKNYNDLINKPTLFSGNYNDLTNKPNSLITTYIPPSSDLNNYKTPGFYYQGLTANARTMVNIPLGQQSEAFGMIVYEASGVIQELTFYNLNYKFIRRFYGNNWSTWKEIPMFAKHGHLNIIGSVPVGSSNTGFALHGNRLKAFRNNHEIFWADAEWCEFTAYPTVNKPQAHYGHSLVRKDYVDNLVANSGGGIKVMWKKENINSNSSYQEFTHNLNIQEQDFYNGKYSVVGFFYKDYEQQVLGLSPSNISQFTIWRDNYPSSETQFSLHTNKIYLRKGSYFGTLKSILIFKNY